MNKWLFLFKEFVLSALLYILVFIAIKYVLNYLGILDWGTSSFAESIVFTVFLFLIFKVQHVKRLLDIGIDFDSINNQNGNLEIELEIILSKEEIINSINNTKSKYSIAIQNSEPIVIQYKESHDPLIRLSVYENNRVSVQVKNESNSLFSEINKSSNWSNLGDHLIKLCEILKLEERRLIKKRLSTLKQQPTRL